MKPKKEKSKEECKVCGGSGRAYETIENDTPCPAYKNDSITVFDAQEEAWYANDCQWNISDYNGFEPDEFPEKD